MEKWNMIDGKEVITAEYVQHLFQLGENASDKDEMYQAMFKHYECHSVGCAVLGGFKKAQGKWNTDFTTEEKTWQRIGNVQYDDMMKDFVPSFNHAEQRLEHGVSVMDVDWMNTISAGFFTEERGIYEVKGIQVAWGSDGEPLIIPTSVPKRIK